MNANVNLSYSVNKILWLLFITHADGSRKGVVFAAVLCVCLFFCAISRKPMQLGSPNLIQKCSTISLENLGSKGQRSRSRGTQKHCRRGFLRSCECWFLLVMVWWWQWWTITIVLNKITIITARWMVTYAISTRWCVQLGNVVGWCLLPMRNTGSLYPILYRFLFRFWQFWDSEGLVNRDSRIEFCHYRIG